MNTDNQFSPEVPNPGHGEGNDLKDTVGWIVNVVLKVGAGYLAKVIIDILF